MMTSSARSSRVDDRTNYRLKLDDDEDETRVCLVVLVFEHMRGVCDVKLCTLVDTVALRRVTSNPLTAGVVSL